MGAGVYSAPLLPSAAPATPGHYFCFFMRCQEGRWAPSLPPAPAAPGPLVGDAHNHIHHPPPPLPPWDALAKRQCQDIGGGELIHVQSLQSMPGPPSASQALCYGQQHFFLRSNSRGLYWRWPNPPQQWRGCPGCLLPQSMGVQTWQGTGQLPSLALLGARSGFQNEIQ